MAAAGQELHCWSHPLKGLLQVCMVSGAAHGPPLAVVCSLQYCQPSPNTSALLHGQALQQGPWDVDKRLKVHRDLSNAAQTLGLILGGDFHIQAYGSYRSGVLFPDSDLDLALTGTCIRQEDGMEVLLHELSREEQNRLLKALANKIKQQQLARGMVRCPLAGFGVL